MSRARTCSRISPKIIPNKEILLAIGSFAL